MPALCRPYPVDTDAVIWSVVRRDCSKTSANASAGPCFLCADHHGKKADDKVQNGQPDKYGRQADPPCFKG